MFRNPALLLFLLLLTGTAGAQAPGFTRPSCDTAVHVIAGQTYFFITTHDSTRTYTLTVSCKGSDHTASFFLDLGGGDCNGRTIQVGDFSLSGSTLTIDYYCWRKNTEDFSNIYSETVLTRDTYMFRKSGELVRTGSRTAKKGDALWNAISARLEKRYDEMYAFCAEHIFGGTP